MSVLLTSAIYIDSVLTAAGTTVSLGYQREQQIVSAGEGTWVSIPVTPTPSPTYPGFASLITDASGNTVAVGADGQHPLVAGGVAAPGVFPTATDSGVAGNLNGTYYYAVTYYTATGETDVNTAIPTPITVTNKQVTLTGIPVSSDSSVIGRYIWRNSAANGNSNDFRKYQLVIGIADNTTTTYIDNIADASLGRTIPSISSVRGLMMQDNARVSSFGSISTTFGVGTMAAGTGYSCSAFGYNALNANTSGIRNTATGVFALAANTTGVENSAFGVHSLNGNLTGNGGSAFGFAALQAYSGTNTNNPPSAFGYKALTSCTTPTTGGNNAFGSYALTALTTADFCSAFGSGALHAVTTGANNSGFGFQAGFAATTGQGITVGGAYAGSTITTGNFLTAFGYNAAKVNTGGNATAVGYAAGQAVTTGSNFTHIGFLAGGYETAGNTLYIDGLNRTDLAGGKANSIIYGVMAAAAANQTLTFNAVIKALTTTVSGLPSAATVGVGFKAFVTDASAPTFGASVTGGGAVPVPVYSDGSAWKVG